MVPLKIYIKNFLSYGSTLQTIDFGTYPLIYLAGKNGHEKSVLVEAIWNSFLTASIYCKRPLLAVIKEY